MWRAAARALAELGCAAFFIAGMASTGAQRQPWAVLAVVLLSFAVRSADLEARALFVRGGLYGSVRDTLGNRPAAVAAAALLADRLMLGALAAVVAGHYLVAFGRSVAGVTSPSLVGDSGPMTFALAAIGVVWLMQRQGRSPDERTVAQAVGASVGVLLFLAVSATISALFSTAAAGPLPPLSPRPLALAAAFGFVLSAIGSVESLGQAALDLEQPRIRNLQRVLRLIGAYGVVITAGLAFLFALDGARPASVWAAAPLSGWRITWRFRSGCVRSWSRWWPRQPSPSWRRLSAPRPRGAYGVLARLVDEGFLDERWRALHHQFGTPWRGIDAVAVTQIAIVLVSGAEASWIARGYAITVVVTAVLKLAALIRTARSAPSLAPTACRGTSKSAGTSGRSGSSARQCSWSWRPAGSWRLPTRPRSPASPWWRCYRRTGGLETVRRRTA